MSRYGKLLPDPKSPDFNQSVVEMLSALARIIDSEIEFGNPQDPQADGGTTLAGTAANNHNGALQNIKGSWVELDVTALDTTVTCYHNLGIPVAVAGEPNVRWLVCGYKHSGLLAIAGSVVSCNFKAGDTVAENSIELRFYAAGTRTVGAAPDALKVSLFFIPAVRRP